MALSAERRLAKVETALSSTELVVAWLTEAHRFDGLDAYTRWLIEQPADLFPANHLLHQAADDTRASLRGRPREEVETAVRKALRETLLRFELVLRINVVADETIQRYHLLHAVFALRFVTLMAQPEDRPAKGGAEVDEQAREWRRLLNEWLVELRAIEAARTSTESRYLAGHSALFPALLRRWDDCHGELEALLGFSTRLGELDGWLDPEGLDDASVAESRVSQLIADLVEPARVRTLEKLDEGARAIALATRWLRPKLQGARHDD
jgi:hypothetical protein